MTVEELIYELRQLDPLDEVKIAFQYKDWIQEADISHQINDFGKGCVFILEKGIYHFERPA